MIYIVAPHALRVNITSHNRIFSFYNTFKKKGYQVKVIFPSPAFSMHWFADEVKGAVADNEDFISIDTELNPIQRFAFRTNLYQRYRLCWYLAYLVHYLVYFKDIYYSNKSLNNFFKTVKLSEGDTVIVSGPPFSLFEETAHFAAQSKSMLILDYRDPWNYGYLPVYRRSFSGNILRFMERRIENKILKAAVAINCVHEKIRDAFPQVFHSKMHIVQNGSNADFIAAEAISEYPEKFKIVYLGTIHDTQLKDESFFKGMARLITAKKINPNKLELTFLGANRNKRLFRILKKYKLETFTVVTDRLNIADTMKEAYQASAFLHLTYTGRQTVYPSKHTDYLALQKAILLPNTDNGVLAESILKNDAGYVSASFDEFYQVLDGLWEKFQRGENMKINRSQDFLYQISREHEAEKLVGIVESLIRTNAICGIELLLQETNGYIPALEAAR